ncbi:hypothetical protein HYV30_03130 [Candidatus Kaiserbacteria bacterium]|nr:hypothetical protein [Candidatus Kaiserbacteria bacterium]
MWAVIRLVFWMLVLVLTLSFFGISIQAIVDSPAGRANFSYIAQLFTQAWQWLTHLL